MSYCVNCGVELDHSAKKCPLCNTPVINPNFPEQGTGEGPFPEEVGVVETVKRKDMAILLTALVTSTALICGLLNLFVFTTVSWSYAVIGVCVFLWVAFIPVVIHTRQPVYISVLYDVGAGLMFLYMLARMINRFSWFWNLGLPIGLLLLILIEIACFFVKRFPKSFFAIGLCFFSSVAILTVGIEMLVDLFVTGSISLSWSAIVATICAIIDIVIITMLSRRRLRNEVRRRLHF